MNILKNFLRYSLRKSRLESIIMMMILKARNFNASCKKILKKYDIK